MNQTSDPLLQPFVLKHLHLKNRIMSTSHACGLEDDGSMPAETYQRYHEEKARGGLALTMFGGSSFVSPDSTWASGQLNVGVDRIIPFLQSFSQRIHAQGAAIMMQLTHLGRRGTTDTHSWLPTMAPSVVRETGHRSIPKAMDRHDIDRVVAAFGDAAARCKAGGLDGIETIVGGHLIGQFLSPITNKRTDSFGGSIANRCRFGLMVQEAIRNRVGDDFIVGMRFLIDEATTGGSNFEECLEMAQIFEQSGLIDFFNANYGPMDTEIALSTYCMPGMSSPIAPWVNVAGAFKKEVNLPVFHAARITDLATARYAISEGLLDMVAMTRAHIADPHIVRKLTQGEEAQIRPCVGATHCMGENRPTCVHNPASGRERFWPQVISPSPHGRKKVVVVGAGPAGLEAARISAERGHEVVVFEAADDMGGQLRMASASNWRKDISGIVQWRRSELARLNVSIHFNILAGIDEVEAQQPDIVVVATGGLPHLGWFDGAEHCTSAWDVLTGATALGDEVIIYDGTGRYAALTAAEKCHSNGTHLALFLLDDRPATELVYSERAIWKRSLANSGILPITEQRLSRVEIIGNRYAAHFIHELTGAESTSIADQIIVEQGTVPADEIYQQLRSRSGNDGVTDIDALLAGDPQPENGNGYVLYRIGDAISSRNVAAAMFDALRLCSVF